MTDLVHATGADVVDEDTIRVTELAWEPQRLLEYEEWAEKGETLQRMHRAMSFWVGDWLAYGATHYPEVWEQAVDLTGVEYKTLQVVMDIAERIPPARRVEGLSWSHHRAVAYIDDETEQDRFLDEAVADGLTVAKLRARVQGRPEPDPSPSLTEGVSHKTTTVYLHAGMTTDDADGLAAAVKALITRKGGQIVTHDTEELQP